MHDITRNVLIFLEQTLCNKVFQELGVITDHLLLIYIQTFIFSSSTLKLRSIWIPEIPKGYKELKGTPQGSHIEI